MLACFHLVNKLSFSSPSFSDLLLSPSALATLSIFFCCCFVPPFLQPPSYCAISFVFYSNLISISPFLFIKGLQWVSIDWGEREGFQSLGSICLQFFCFVVCFLSHYWTGLSQMKSSLHFLTLNGAWSLWHSYGLFLVVQSPLAVSAEYYASSAQDANKYYSQNVMDFVSFL